MPPPWTSSPSRPPLAGRYFNMISRREIPFQTESRPGPPSYHQTGGTGFAIMCIVAGKKPTRGTRHEVRYTLAQGDRGVAADPGAGRRAGGGVPAVVGTAAGTGCGEGRAGIGDSAFRVEDRSAV